MINKPKTLRCAVYTRKSSEEGLEQGFNSLHAQREACEAYMLSQAGEGWSAIKTLYDDGGFSGGNMERPALKRLLGDVAENKIDVIVVYKIDRLTRSLMDFAKIVEVFDAAGVSFVSVTQAFNTTTSMGRLTLNVLLSFAQFEREVTGERIRDKIAASKKKGMWMGGVPPLGYDSPTDPITRALVINAAEAVTVNLIFQKYLELGSVRLLERWLTREAVLSKRWTTAKGVQLGGLPFNRGALFHLLKSPTYIGQIPHKDTAYPGAHPPIVHGELFAKVQTSLAAKAMRHKDQPKRVATMALRGLIFDAEGEPMIPTFTHKGSKAYRYYVAQNNAVTSAHRQAIRRVGADLIEGLVADCVHRLGCAKNADMAALLDRVEIHAATVQILIYPGALFKRRSDPEAELGQLRTRLQPEERIAIASEDRLRVTLPCKVKRHGGKCKILDPAGRSVDARTRPDRTLIKGLRAAHRLIAQHADCPIGLIDAVSMTTAAKNPYHRNLSRLTFLAPDIQRAILEGRQPADLTLTRLLASSIPAAWEDQRRLFLSPGSILDVD